jgi:hypothetical protein
VVVRTLEHERRRQAAERDASIYAAGGVPTGLDDLASWAAAQPLEDMWQILLLLC